MKQYGGKPIRSAGDALPSNRVAPFSYLKSTTLSISGLGIMLSASSSTSSRGRMATISAPEPRLSALTQFMEYDSVKKSVAPQTEPAG